MAKKCSVCKNIKEISEFYPSKTTKDGFGYRCKPCDKEANHRYQKSDKSKARYKAWRIRNQKRLNYLSMKRYYSRDKTKRRISWRKAAKKQRLVNADHTQARNRVRMAIKRGKFPPIKTKNCVKCGAQAAHYHHTNGYDRANWFTVIPLCRSCHYNVHNPIGLSLE